MGRIAKLLSFARATRHDAKVSDVKVDRGGGDNRTLEHFSAPGDDSHPLPGDYVAALPQAGTGRDSAVAYLDPLNDPKAGAGEKRIYARDPETKLEVCEVWLKGDGTVLSANSAGSSTLAPDGSIKGQNDLGSFELQSNGVFLVNGVSIDTAGNIISPTTITGLTVAATSSLTVAGKEQKGHKHPQGVDSDGDTQQDTGAQA